LNFKLIPDDTTATSAFLNGEIDQVQLVTGMDVDLAESDPAYQVYRIRQAAMHMIAFNSSREPFTDVRIRQAIYHGTNKQRYGDLALDKLAYVGTNDTRSVLDTYEEGYSEGIKVFEYDVEKAKELLQEAGYGPGELTIEMSTSTSLIGRAFASVFQEQMKAIGINVNILELQPGAFQNLQKSGDFQAAYILAVGYPYDVVLFHRGFWRQNGSAFFLQFKNDEFERMITESEVDSNYERRRETNAAAHRLISEEAYYVPVARSMACMAMPAGIRGISFEPSLLLAKYRDWYMEDWEGFYDPSPGLTELAAARKN
jgi:peptide/nickel transport system substrate-binding protein